MKEIAIGFGTLVKLCAGAVRRYHCTTGGGSRRRARGRQPNQPTLADISWTPWWTQARGGLLAHPHGAVALCRSPRGRRGYDYRQLPPARPEPGGTHIQYPRCANPPPCYAGQPPNLSQCPDPSHSARAPPGLTPPTAAARMSRPTRRSGCARRRRSATRSRSCTRRSTPTS